VRWSFVALTPAEVHIPNNSQRMCRAGRSKSDGTNCMMSFSTCRTRFAFPRRSMCPSQSSCARSDGIGFRFSPRKWKRVFNLTETKEDNVIKSLTIY
jgi:hypothetical protein